MYSELLKLNRELGLQLNSEKYQIALLSNIVVDPLKDILEFTLRKQGINADVVVGDYDNLVQDSVRLSTANAVVIFWEAANLVEGLHAEIAWRNSDDIIALEERVENEIAVVLRNLLHIPIVLINSFSSLLFSNDELRDGPLKLLCNRLNFKLSSHVAASQLVVNLDSVLAKTGCKSAVDFRQYQSSKALYTIGFFKAYAGLVEPAFLAATGRMRKVLVLDCDNTLWGGVLGEDGINGIQLGGSTSKGRVFREVQQILKGFQRQGILLALCSKNNPEDIDNVFETHSEMVLKAGDLVRKKINWKNKAANLQELASELNLGLDSFVFIDDSPFEIGLIERELPQVRCVRVPDVLSEYPSVMSEVASCFFSISQTTEDLRKTEQYHQEQVRRSQVEQFSTIDEYLASLGLNLRILWGGQNVPVPRLAQMTQKTNQFNLTTRRYTESDIQRFLADSNYLVAAFSVDDRYGDAGITGLAIIEREKERAEFARIDTLLMSCRVIGRNVEFAFFNRLVEKLDQVGISILDAEYIATPKNGQVSNFYRALGFAEVNSSDSSRNYTIDINAYSPRNINYISILEGDDRDD